MWTCKSKKSFPTQVALVTAIATLRHYISAHHRSVPRLTAKAAWEMSDWLAKVTQPCPAARILLLQPEAVVPGAMGLLRESCLWENGSGVRMPTAGADENRQRLGGSGLPQAGGSPVAWQCPRLEGGIRVEEGMGWLVLACWAAVTQLST